MAPLLRLCQLGLAFGLPFVNAVLSDGRRNANTMPRPVVPKVDPPTDGPVTSRNGSTLPPYTTVYYFNQLIDHTNPSLGTFQQRYWHTWEWYEPGGPIIMTTPGEIDADGYSGYLTNKTIDGQIAQQQSGATIVLEHRFYGESNPYPDLSVTSLRVHTLQQAIDDLEYFAQNVDLPMPGGDQVGPDKAPWIMIGGSYAGALTAWTMVNKPGLFWAAYSSSGVVEALVDYWAYFEPIREYMPQNCSADVQAVIAHVDSVFMGTDTNAINTLKSTFGLSEITHLDDAAGSLRNNLWDWQSLQPTSGPGGAFFVFCDALEVKNGKSAPAGGWGLDHALSAWGSYFKNTYLSELCGGEDVVDCLGTYDATSSYFTDTAVGNSGRSWNWIVCNEVGYLQESPPVGHPALVSRLIQPAYDIRQCQYMFPEAFSVPTTPNVNATNDAYGGWNLQANRLFFANGQRDPWRDVTVSADGLDIASTATQPIAVGDGFHCSDLSTSSAAVDETILAVQQKALAAMKTWLSEWTAPGAKPPAPQTFSVPKTAKVTTNNSIQVNGGKAVNAWSRGSGVL